MTSKHTATPWVYHSGMVWKPDGSEEGIPIAHMDREAGNGTVPVERDQNAQFIVRACNAHDELVEALETALSGFAWRAEDGDKEACTDARLLEKALTKAKA